MNMEPIEVSETSAIRTKTPGNYPEENILHSNICPDFHNNTFCDGIPNCCSSTSWYKPELTKTAIENFPGVLHSLD